MTIENRELGKLIGGFYDSGYFYTILLWENNLDSSTQTQNWFVKIIIIFWKILKYPKKKI